MSRRRLSDVLNAAAPESYQCAISMTIMRDPVIDPEGYTYERGAIEEWLNNNTISPMTRTPLTADKLVPNRALRDSIEEFAEKLLKENDDLLDDWTRSLRAEAKGEGEVSIGDTISRRARDETKGDYKDTYGDLTTASSNGSSSDIANAIHGEEASPSLMHQLDPSLRHNAVRVIRTSDNGRKMFILKSEIERILRPQCSIRPGELKSGNGTTFRVHNLRDGVTRGLTVLCTHEQATDDEMKIYQRIDRYDNRSMLQGKFYFHVITFIH